jgi:hypothetical protein
MRRPSPALVLSCLALFLGFTGGAVAAVQIGGKQIRDSSITGKDIKNDSLTPTDFKGSVRGPAGARGETGPAGPAGAPGASLEGSAGAGEVSYRELSEEVPGGTTRTVTVPCPGDQVPTGGGYFGAGLSVAASYPEDIDSNGRPDAWSVTADNGDMGAHTLRVDVTCITPTTVSSFLPV